MVSWVFPENHLIRNGPVHGGPITVGLRPPCVGAFKATRRRQTNRNHGKLSHKEWAKPWGPISCHKRRHDLTDPKSAPERVPGSFFTWSQIEHWIGPGFKPYLNDDGQRINCGTFKLQLNPDAPDIILPGKRVKGWELRAIKFAEQSEAIPVFVKAEGLPWEYVGNKRVEATVRNPREIGLHAARSRRLSKDGFADRTGDISLVMFLT